MSDHVEQVYCSCHYRLRQLRHVRCSMTPDAVEVFVHAFISSHLDYCNSLLTGVCNDVLRKLQSVKNAAARLIIKTRKSDHITPVLRDSHWLPVRQQIVFQTTMLVYKCLCGLGPFTTMLVYKCLCGLGPFTTMLVYKCLCLCGLGPLTTMLVYKCLCGLGPLTTMLVYKCLCGLGPSTTMLVYKCLCGLGP